MAPEICGSSVQNLLYVTILGLEFWDGFEIFGKFVHPDLINIHLVEKKARSRIQTSVSISAHEHRRLLVPNLAAHTNTLALVKFGVSFVFFILTVVLLTFCTVHVVF